MALHHRHLTTEQLSALLDDALPAQERVLCEAHLHTCQSCQQSLAELRQTVALLHALPQPALPRSFMLSADMLSAEQPVEALTTPALTPPVLPFPSARRRSKPGFVFTTLRFASGIAAVIGLVLLTASLFSALPHAMMGASTASNSTTSGGSAMGGSIAPEHSTPSNGTKTASNGDNGTAANNQHATPVTPAIRPQVTPGPRIIGPPTPDTGTASPSPFTPPDLTTPGGQALLGLLLFVLGILGLLLLRWQRNRQARAPTYPRQE